MGTKRKGMMKRDVLLDHCLRVVSSHLADDIELSARGVYYALVTEGVVVADQKGITAKRGGNARRIAETMVDAKRAGTFPLEWLRDDLRIPDSGSVGYHCDDEHRALSAVGTELSGIHRKYLWSSHWYGQPVVPVVVYEKDTLTGTLKRALEDNRVPWICLRGYPSWSAMYAWYEMMVKLMDQVAAWGGSLEVVYIGDHDPDGMYIPVTMQETTDIMGAHKGRPLAYDWNRLMVTREQALSFEAPDMGVKLSSTRAEWYLENFGDEAWEAEAYPAALARDHLDRTLKGFRHADVVQRHASEVAAAQDRLRELMTAEWVLAAMGLD